MIKNEPETTNLSTKTVRLIDVARYAGVSRSAVASVLLGSAGKGVRVSEKTSSRIREVAKQLDYRPNAVAQTLAGKRSYIIGAIIDRYAPIPSYTKLSEMENQAAKLGYRFMIGQTHGEYELYKKYANDFVSHGVDGIICLSHNYPDTGSAVSQFLSKFKNIVFIEKPMEIDSDTYFVEVDIADGVRQSIEHLYHRGKRRIGIVSMDDLYAAIQSTFNAYHQTLNKYGLSDEPVLQSRISPGTSEDMKSEEIEALISQIVLNGKADAILARNDFMALMAIKTLRSLKLRIPEDVAVIGSDNIPVCRMVDPMITSVDHNNEIVAAKAVEMVTHLIEGRSIPEDQRQMVVKPTLVVRESA